MNALLDGKVAVVTGAARGIGAVMAEVLLAQGAKVMLSDIDGDAVHQTVDRLTRGAVRAEHVAAHRCDVRDEHEVETMADAAHQRFGGLDVWVNNAGVTRDATMLKMSLEDFRLVVDVHLTGCWLGTRAAGRRMKAQGHGSIINISSLSGKVGVLGQTNYSAAKAGIVGLTKAAAKELARAGVRVNAIQPGLIATAMTAAMPQDVLASRIAEIPLGRIGRPDDIANAAVFLASDLSTYLTGTVTEVSGGRHM